MPPAIRARKAQHRAAPMCSPTPEAAERAVISAVSRAPRAPTAQDAQQRSQQAAETGGSGGRKKEQSSGRGGGQSQDACAQKGEHQSAQRQGTQCQDQERTEAAFHRTSLSIRNAQVRPAGNDPAVHSMPRRAPGCGRE